MKSVISAYFKIFCIFSRVAVSFARNIITQSRHSICPLPCLFYIWCTWNMEEGRFPPSFQISRQLDQEKINFLTRRVEELVQSNNDLRISSGQNEKDTHDIVIYFQREMEIKDDVIMKLNEELVKCQTQLKFEVEKVRKTFEEELTEIRTSSESTITSLSEKLETCESELKAVYAFKKAKDQHEGTIARLEKNLQQQREQLIDAMEEQERRFLEEKAALFKDLDEQKAAFREVPCCYYVFSSSFRFVCDRVPEMI